MGLDVSTTPPRSWRTSLLLGARISAATLVTSAVVWLVASQLADRYVAGSLAIAMLNGANLFFSDVLARRASVKVALIAPAIVMPVVWWLMWLMLTYDVRRP